MTAQHHLALYDASFYRWLDKQAARGALQEEAIGSTEHKPVQRIELTQLLRREFEPKILARLNALGFAT